MTELTTKPNESSTMVVTVTFRDIDGVLFTPKTCTWSLTDTSGTIINSRSRVTLSVISPATSATIVLSGLDLKYDVGKSAGMRVVTIEGTYDSVYGSNLPFRDEASFQVLDTALNAL